jgi:putative restriction endonuclease
MLPTAEDLIQALTRIERLRTHRSDGLGRALKKPLLLLLLIARFQAERVPTNVFRFSDLEQELAAIIREFGGREAPSGPKPEQPFFHFELWQRLDTPLWVREGKRQTAPISALRDPAAQAVLDPTLFSLLQAERTRALLAQAVLDRYWPETVHGDIRERLALPASVAAWGRLTPQTRPGRERAFTEMVLHNYHHRCAMCGFQARLGDRHFGLDAAHLRWFTCEGPDELGNGLALCKLHHWSLDRGVTSLASDHTILLSPHFVALDSCSRDLFQELQGRPIAEPRVRLDPQHIEWHASNVFRAG